MKQPPSPVQAEHGRAAAEGTLQRVGDGATAPFVDRRSIAAAQHNLNGMVSGSARQSAQLRQAAMMNKGGASRVAQLEPAWKEDNHPDKVLDPFAAALEEAVLAGASTALTAYDTLTADDGYTALWKSTADLLMTARDGEVEEEDVAEANIASRFAPARYGYAVESYANERRGDLSGALPGGYAVQIQGSRGMTRPDFIVKDGSKSDVGWFDVTSEGSLGHIDKKTGSGWQTKRYVAEITYPPFNLDNLAMSKSSIGTRVRARNFARRQREGWQSFLEHKYNVFLKNYELAVGDETAKHKQQRAAQEAMALTIGKYMTEGETLDCLRAFGLTVGKFGYKAGGTKSGGETILRDLMDNE